MMLPNELEWVLEMLGYNWPTADEDKLKDCAKLWRKFGDDVTELHTKANTSARQVVAHNAGDSIDAFTKTYAKFDSGGDGYLANAAQAAYIIATVLEACAYLVEFAKWAVIAQLIALAIEIAAAQAAAPFTFGLSEVGALGATQAARLIVRRLLKELKDALLEAIVEAMKEPAISMIEAIITDLIRQTVNVGFGAQEGYDLATTAKQGANAGWDAIKQTPQTLAEGVRDSLGEKAGHKAHHAIDSRIDGHGSSGSEGGDGDAGGDGDGGSNSADGSGSSESSGGGDGNSDSSTSGSGSDSGSDSGTRSDSDGSGSSTSTHSSNDVGSNIGGGISADTGGNNIGGPDVGDGPGSGSDSGAGSHSVADSAAVGPTLSHSGPTLSDFDDPSPSGASADDSGSAGSSDGPSSTGPSHSGGGSSVSGLSSPTVHTVSTPVSSGGTSSSSTGGHGSIGTSIDSLAASAPTHTNAAPTHTPTASASDPSSGGGGGGRPDGGSGAMPTAPVASAVGGGAGGSHLGVGTSSGSGGSSATSPSSPTANSGTARATSTATTGTATPSESRPASTPSPTPSTAPRSTPASTPTSTPTASTSASARVSGTASAGDGRVSGTADGRTPGTPDGRIPGQRTPGSATPGDGTRPRETPGTRPGDGTPPRSTTDPTGSTRTRTPGQNTSTGTGTGTGTRAGTSTSSTTTPSTSTGTNSGTAASSGTDRTSAASNGTSNSSGSSGRTPNSSTPNTSTPNASTPTSSTPTSSTPNSSTANQPGPSPQNTPGAGTTPPARSPQQPAGSSPAAPNTPQQPAGGTANAPQGTPSSNNPQQQQHQQQHVTPVPVHTVIRTPASSATPSHAAGSASPHAPGSPQAMPGSSGQPHHPQQDSLEDIRSDLDHYPGGLTDPDPTDQQALDNAVPRNEDGTPQRHPDPFEGNWSQLQNDGGVNVPGRSNNCADCSRSFLETWYGNPQVSAPRTLDTDANGKPDLWSPEDNANDNQIRWTGAAHTYAGPGGDPNTAANIANTLQQAGPGSAAIVQVDWPGGGGHAFNVVNHNGNIVWVDTQSGQVSSQPLHIDQAAHVWHIPLDADRNPIDTSQPPAQGSAASAQGTNTGPNTDTAPPNTDTAPNTDTTPPSATGPDATPSTPPGSPDDATASRQTSPPDQHSESAPAEPAGTPHHAHDAAQGEDPHPKNDPARVDHPRLTEPETIHSTHYGMSPMPDQQNLRQTNDVRQLDLDPVHQHLNNWLDPIPNEDGNGTRVPLVDALRQCSPPRPDDPDHTPTVLRHDDLARVLPGFADMHPGERGAVVASLARLSLNFHASHGVGASPEPTPGYPDHGRKAHESAGWNSAHRRTDPKESPDHDALEKAIRDAFGRAGFSGALRDAGEHHPDFTGRNYATVEVYDPHSRQISYVVDSSYPNPGGGESGKHSEKNILDYLRQLNDNRPDGNKYEPLSMYSDREPCGHGQGYANCARLLSEEVPGVDIHYGTGYRKNAEIADPAESPAGGYKKRFDKDFAKNIVALGRVWVRAMAEGGLRDNGPE
ncbi:toxin glutamine deamidase domain-containing protein [Streptomyces sp. NPDC005648]|uniref:toxin glutamine deamidase domain-containing protein n=1 Tax=Streptomyces sp. NPDC005648 TaxID=3157044 RepID=UPI0033BF53D4